MTILVTGAAGFIGRHLIRRLLLEGYDVLALIHVRSLDQIVHPHLKVIRGDLEAGEIEIPHEVDTVVHLVGTFTEEQAIRTNVITTHNILRACINARINKFIFSSSYAVYGETYLKGASESDAPRPVTIYGLSKLFAEHIVKFYAVNYGISSMVLRLSSVYGPRSTVGVVHDFISSVKRDGTVVIHDDGLQTRDFLYIDDAINGIISAIKYTPKSFEIFNISTGLGCTILQLVEMLEEVMRCQIKRIFTSARKSDVRCLVAKNCAAKQALGFKPSVSLYEGLIRTVRRN